MKKTNVLAIFANPKGSIPLRLEAEDRVMHECFRLSRHRDNLELDVRHAATVHDLRRALLERDYQIVHFSGHGTGRGLALEDDAGNIQVIAPDALAIFLSKYSSIECVLLNACYSDLSGQLVSAGLPYAIGMKGPISDASATEFTRGFYDAVGAGKDIEFAYREGCDTLKLLGLPDSDVPLLFVKSASGVIPDDKVSPTPFVFISYAREDGLDKAEQLRSELSSYGIRSWFHSGRLDPYSDFGGEIEKNILRASQVVVCVTPSVRDDILVRREIAFALEEKRPIVRLLFPGGRSPIAVIDQVSIDFAEWNKGFLCLLERFTESGHDGATAQTPEDLETAYLQGIGRRYDHWHDLYTDMAATAQIEQSKVKVRRSAAVRYLDMRHDIFRDISYDVDPDRVNLITVENFDQLFEGIKRYKRVALIGDPGAGKTTTLERLAYDLASSAAEDSRSPLPLFVRLGAFRGGDFTSFLAESFDGLPLQSYFPDRVFLLLDGLNEMPPEFIPLVHHWLERNPETRVIITCRKLDYVGLRLPLQRIDVVPLDVRRIYQFINNYLDPEDSERLFWALSGTLTRQSWDWYCKTDPNPTFDGFWFGRIEDARSWHVEKYHIKQVQEMLRRDSKLPGMLGVVSNPFLLFVVIQLYAREGEPPTNRGQLFDRFVTLLIEQRGKLGSITRPPWIEGSIQRRALSALAYRMQMERKGTSVDTAWAHNVIEQIQPEYEPEQLLYLAASAGLIERGTGIRFTHQLVQEYFSAHEMCEDVRRGVPATKYWPSEQWWEPTGWEETVILASGLRGNSTDIVRWLTPVQPTLAFRCATESGADCDEGVLRDLYEPPVTARMSPLPRAKWGRIMADRDQRPGVRTKKPILHSIKANMVDERVPDIVWCNIPRGEFFIGGDSDAWNAWRGMEIEILYDYWLAKYPITYAQYELFVRGDGYTNDEYWTVAGREWRKDKNEPRYWNDPNYHFANHPVIGISWYEAYAYTQWLNQRLALLEVPNGNCVVRLPTEAEWERAARYPDGRLFPWGNRYVPGYANLDETDEYRTVGPYYLRCTTAVGLYPYGANPNTDVHDMSGTVWEWGLTRWNDEYSYPENSDPEGIAPRILRGGSWSNNEALARCCARHRYPPTDNGDRRGFRLCLAPDLR